MYNNSQIINNNKNYKKVLILLHPMYCDTNYFNTYINYFKENNLEFYKNTKFILVQSPRTDIDYPNNKEYNINSWYNYYTCYNGLNKIDIININHFNNQSNRIINIINNESKIIKPKNIYLLGVSQGGTLIFNILNKLKFNIGGLFAIKTIYMDNFINANNNKNTPIYIYSGANDEIYPLILQKNLINILKKNNYKIIWKIIENLNHSDIINEEYKFILNNIY
tara:strand:+ start:341 stop:1009 length:669 start_codon:yes stop_codon:yes gene_type:complete